MRVLVYGTLLTCVSRTMRVTVTVTVLTQVCGTRLQTVYGTCSVMHRGTQVVTGTCSHTSCSHHTFLQRVSDGHCSQTRTHLPGFCTFLQVQGSKQHSPHSRTQWCLTLPGTQYSCVTHSPHFLCTVFMVVHFS